MRSINQLSAEMTIGAEFCIFTLALVSCTGHEPKRPDSTKSALKVTCLKGETVYEQLLR